jgi:allophanate hydrolase subunit 2
VQPGTVQLTPSGSLIALMRDAQTTGGYARVLQLPAESIDRLARLPVSSTFKFAIESLKL